MLSSEDSIALVYYGVIREYGWRYVSIIAQDETIFTVVRIETICEMQFSWKFPRTVFLHKSVFMYSKPSMIPINKKQYHRPVYKRCFSRSPANICFPYSSNTF